MRVLLDECLPRRLKRDLVGHDARTAPEMGANKISDDFYASPRTLTNYFNRAAFAQPAPGTLGNLTRNAVVGPAYWNVDLGISRLLPMGTRRLELRVEAFNVLNHFNWGNPVTNLNSGQFGRITSLAGTPPNGVYGTMRIMQFGIKYDF